MRFEEFQYIRPNMDDWKTEFDLKLEAFNNAENFEAQVKAMEEINDLRNSMDTMRTLCSIRYTIDSTDEFYTAEQDYFDEISPLIEEKVTEFYKELVSSKYKSELEGKFGRQLFALAEGQLKTFSPEIIELLQQENKLTSEYGKLVAAAKIQFDGKEQTIAQLSAYAENKDRNVRRESIDARSSYYSENLEKFDGIYDKLVTIRTEIAQKLGYKNFIELGYYRMGRTDYTPEMVVNYRKQIVDQVVPLVSKLYKRQEKRIGVDELKFYDEKFNFKSGNAEPQGTPEWIIENGQKMYEEMSSETGEFFNFMVEHNLLDLVAKKGKQGGGYCTYLPDFKSPFIFSNFNGTSGDIDVLTHEVGHAFQCYSSRGFEVPEYGWPTMEACEIHSMSMEFFAWPWMKLFFKELADKYFFSHLSDGLIFLPYGVMVDHFQHIIYENPELTPEERRTEWSKLEKIYLPERNYDGNAYLLSGGAWQRQSHIYEAPFYYIDYTLAQVCAFQFWKKMHENRDEAWSDYVHLCRQGGSKSFLELVKEAKLISPFEDGCLASVVTVLEEYLNGIDDQAL